MSEWISTYLNIEPSHLYYAAAQTFYMIGWSLLIGALLGTALGVGVVFTRPNGLHPTRIIYTAFNAIINVFRSIPFVILLVFIAPLTRVIMGTRIGTRAALVPLVIFIAPYLARLIEQALLDVSPGIVEASQAMGATPWQSFRYFLLPEALPSLVLAIATGTIGLLGATAMAGAIGGGGVGDLALTYGYERFNNTLMVATVVILIVFVQAIQALGNSIARRIRIGG